MATRTDEAICLRQLDWSETSQVVTLFGREVGRVRALVKGARRERAPYSGGLEALTRGEMVAIIKSSGAMATLTAWDLLDPHAQLRRSLPAHYGAIYLADATQRSLSELDPHPALYDALAGALRDLGRADVARTCLRYLWILLDEIGYRPDLRSAGEADIVGFDPGAGRLVAPGAAASWPVRMTTIRALRAIDTAPPDADATTIRALRLIDAYLAHLLGRPLPAAEAFFGPGGPAAPPA